MWRGMSPIRYLRYPTTATTHRVLDSVWERSIVVAMMIVALENADF